MIHDELEKLLSANPGTILAHELALIELTRTQNKEIQLSDEIKTSAKIEADMNLNFKNEGQRKASVELKLKDNAVYQECVNRIVERTTAILIAEASLAYQRDIFRSYLAIAGMVNK